MSSFKVVTGKVRFSYANVFEPRAMDEGAQPKYSVSIIIPKKDTDTLNKIKEAIKNAEEAGRASQGAKPGVLFRNPLRDGDVDKPDDAAYANSYFVNANSINKPGIVDADRQYVMDRDDFYSGCYGRASVAFYPYHKSGNRGVACGLNNLQKLADGENLTGASSAEADFSDDLTDLV